MIFYSFKINAFFQIVNNCGLLTVNGVCSAAANMILPSKICLIPPPPGLVGNQVTWVRLSLFPIKSKVLLASLFAPNSM